MYQMLCTACIYCWEAEVHMLVVICLQLGWHPPLAKEAQAQSWVLLALWLPAGFRNAAFGTSDAFFGGNVHLDA